jgi:DNA-binding PadR family transcriptional regulator
VFGTGSGVGVILPTIQYLTKQGYFKSYKKRLMATKKEKIVQALMNKGVELTGEETLKELRVLYKEHIGEDGDLSDDNAVVWLKTQAYVNDKERLNAGVYVMDKVPERLTKLSNREVEIFADGNVPARKLVDMAKWAGFNHTEEMEDEEILKKVVSVPVPFA